MIERVKYQLSGNEDTQQLSKEKKKCYSATIKMNLFLKLSVID